MKAGFTDGRGKLVYVSDATVNGAEFFERDTEKNRAPLP